MTEEAIEQMNVLIAQQGLPLGVTAKKIFNENDFRYKAIYAHSSPIVLIQSV